MKSDNIIISDKCFARILDFGFSNSNRQKGDLGDGTFTSKLGTPAYMAPEIHSGKPYSGAEVDIFALGVVLF